MKFDLYITGEITEESFVQFSKDLSDLEHSPKSKSVVNVFLNSEGGSAYAALAYFDRIKISSLSVNITAIGLVASAAVLILAAGKERTISRSSWVMVHEDSVPYQKGNNVTRFERDASHARRLEDQWNDLLESTTKANSSLWERMHREETYLTADECLNLGLVDKVI